MWQQLAPSGAPLRAVPASDVHARECGYAADVAARYLDAAADEKRLRRLATWLWRADQCLDRAEAAKAKSNADAGQEKRPDASRADSLQPCARATVLLNGV